MKNIFLALSLFTAQLNVATAQEIHVAEADTQANCLTRCFQRLGIRHTPSARIEKGCKLVATRLTSAQLTQILNDYEAITEIELTRSPSTIRELEGVIDAFERLVRHERFTIWYLTWPWFWR